MGKYDLFIFAGEASGDLHAEHLIKDLKKLANLNICAVGGPLVRKLGVHMIMDLEEFNVMGFVDVLWKLPRLIKNFIKLKSFILKENPKACIFIDYPEFNLRLEKSLKKNGYRGKLIHYICPTVWAWRKNRIKTLEENLNSLLCIFPFEKKYFQNNLRVEYVGNPLVCKKETHKYESDSLGPSIGVFPGSRQKEIERNLPMQLDCLKYIFKTYPSYFFVISIADEKWKNLIHAIAKPYKNIFKERLIFAPSSKSYDIMQNLSLAIATSGTVTLELALHKVPTIVTYKINPFDLFLVKNILKINLPFYCIVNIISQKLIFPELYGPQVNEKNLHYWITKLLLEKNESQKIIGGCDELINSLKKTDYNKTAALSILKTTYSSKKIEKLLSK